jgi:hypothetical protein
MEHELQASVSSKSGDEGGRRYFEIMEGIEDHVRSDLDETQRVVALQVVRVLVASSATACL